MLCVRWMIPVVTLLLGLSPVRGGEPASWTRAEDVIYGRKHGVTLTLDVFTPCLRP